MCIWAKNDARNKDSNFQPFLLSMAYMHNFKTFDQKWGRRINSKGPFYKILHLCPTFDCFLVLTANLRLEEGHWPHFKTKEGRSIIIKGKEELRFYPIPTFSSICLAQAITMLTNTSTKILANNKEVLFILNRTSLLIIL